jgi:hypothetical protein
VINDIYDSFSWEERGDRGLNAGEKKIGILR